jgi:hypothetical protein
MTDQNEKRTEFEPIGEGSISPDIYDGAATDDGGYDCSKDSVNASRRGYLGENNDDLSDDECRSCRAPIPTSRTQCDFCLVNQIDRGDTVEKPDSERTFAGIIHAVITAESKPDAITKATAAFNGLTADPSMTDAPSIDEYELIANSTGETARQLAREWGQLPDAAPLESLDGQRLLDTVRQNANWDDAISEGTAKGEERDEQELEPVLFNADGEPITEHDELTDLLEHGSLDQMTTARRRYRTSDTDEQPRWIVPAFALQDNDPDKDQPETGRYDRPTRRWLSCIECDSETKHVFSGSQELPDPEWGGDPIWECTRCEAPRFGPDPATVDDRSDEANGS